MSAPTREFSDLRLEAKDMANRRSIAQQERRRREHEERVREEHALQNQQYRQVQPAPQRSPAPAGPLIQSYSGIRYNATNMPQGAYLAALKVLGSQMFTVDLAMSHEDENGPYSAFQLKKTESVRVYSFEPSPNRRNLRCTCEEFRAHDGICSHIYWIYDGVNDVLYSDARKSPQNLDIYSISNRLSSLFPAISARVSTLPDALNCRGEDNAESDTGDDAEDIMVIQDMVSFFDQKRLPSDFDDDFVDNLPRFEKSYSKLMMAGDPAASLFNLARHDPVFRDRLRNALPPEICASNFLSKLEQRAKRAFSIYDNYVAEGPLVKQHFISGCADELRGVISVVADYQRSRGPTTIEFDSRAARLALQMLTGTIDRDKDIYASSGWLKAQAPPSSQVNRNLFTNLIRSPPKIEDSEIITRELFVLDLLSNNLRATQWGPLLGSLKELPDLLENKNVPESFLDKFLDLLNTDHEAWGYVGASRNVAREHRTTSSRRASSIIRRPEAQGQPEPQRRRID